MIIPAYVHKAILVAAVASWLTLLVLSLLPGNERPHTGFSGNVEHFVAYLLAGAVTKIAFHYERSRLLLLALSLAAAAFEVAQIWIPLRHPGTDNWAASTFGAMLGIGLARLLNARLRTL